MAAIAVGTAALIIVLSVFNGFEGLVKGLYTDFYADVQVTPQHGKYFTITSPKLSQLSKIQGVAAINPVIEEKAVLVNGDYQSIIYLKGVSADFLRVTPLHKHIVRGVAYTGNVSQPRLLLGVGIEGLLGVDVVKGIHPITVFLPNGSSNANTLTDALGSYDVVANGSFAIQQEFDDKYAFTSVAFVQYMLGVPAQTFSSVEIRLAQKASFKKVSEQVQALFGNTVTIKTRYQQNQSLFAVMQLEKWFIYAVLSLILAVSSFNIVGALAMLILEKQTDISVLKTLGASNATITRIFLVSGVLIVAIGAAVGMVLALIVVWLQQTFHLVKLQGGSFIIDYYPAKLLWADFLLVGGTIFCIAFLASVVPSIKAGRRPLQLKSQ